MSDILLDYYTELSLLTARLYVIVGYLAESAAQNDPLNRTAQDFVREAEEAADSLPIPYTLGEVS